MRILMLVLLLFAVIMLITACSAEQDNVHGGQETVTQEEIDQLGQDIESLDVEDLGGLEE